MTRRWGWTTAMVVVVATAVCLGAAAQKPGAAKPQQSAEQLMGVALHQEEVEGSLQAAIATYQQVLKVPGVPRALAARAQFRIGACYERLGVDGARKAYEAVVANYGDQGELAAQAKARLVALGGGAPARVAGASAEVLRQVWPAEPGYFWDRISPDGRQVAGSDDVNGDIFVRELDSGRMKNLTNRLAAGQTDGYCLSSLIWSRDGRFVAANCSEGQAPARVRGLRINDLRDGSARFLPLDSRFDLATLLDWAVDGQSVLVRVGEKREAGKKWLGALAWMSVSTGAIRPLMVLDPPGGPITAFQSPDAKWVAVREGVRSAPTLILSSDGKDKRELLPVMENARLVGWSPNGEHLIFYQLGGAGALIAVRVIGGKADGPPFVVRRLPGFRSLGMTTDGRLLFTSVQTGAQRLHAAPFELATRSVGPAVALSPSEFTIIDLVSWSPDGNTLAYIGSDGAVSRKTLAVWSFETRQTRTYSLPMPTSPINQLTWTSDGRSIYARQTDKGRNGLYRVLLVTGAVEAVVPVDSGVFPFSLDTTFVGWSPDATRLYKKVNLREGGNTGPTALIEVRLPDRAERELFRTSAGNGIGAFAVSPDGSTLAFSGGERQGGGLILVPASGGPARVLVPGRWAGMVYWSADGRFVFTWSAGEPESAWMFDVASGSGTRLALTFETVRAVTLSPDNRQLAFVGGTEQKDEGVWMLENFLPPAKAPAKKKP